MGKFKIGLQLNVNYLRELCNEKTSGVSIQKCQRHLVMHPIHLKNFNGSIKDLLNQGIAKFDKRLGGIMLGYENIRLINKKGIIHNDSSGIHVDLDGDFYVFKPTIGREMQGVVNRKGKDFVGVLVYNTFNVSVPKPQSEDIWLGHEVQIGDEILFQLQQVDTSLHLPYIRGEILSIIAKSNVMEDTSTKTNKTKRNVVLSEDVAMDDETCMQEETENVEETRPKKKKKKSLEKTQELEMHEIVDHKVKKSKKRKLSVSSPDGEQKLSLKKSKKSKYSEIPT